MNTLTPEHAKELVNGFDSLPEAEKPKAAQLLKDYAAKRAEQGLGAFQTPPGVSRDRRKQFEAFYADSNGLVNVLPEGERKSFEDAAASTGNAEEAKLRAVNQAWFAENQPDMADVAFKNWPAVRASWAKAAFGVDKPEVGEKDLFGLIGGKLAEARARDEFLADAFQTLQLEASKGGSFVEAWRKVGQGMAGRPGWSPEAHDKFREAGQQLFSRVNESIAPLKPAIDLGRAYYSLAAQGEVQGENGSNLGDIQAAKSAFVDALMRLDTKQREQALGFAIAGAAEDAPKVRGAEGKASGVEKAAVQLERAIGGFGGNIARIAQQTAGVVAPYYAKPTLDAQYERREAERLVDEGLTDAVDPIKSKSRIVQGVYDAIDSLPYMATALVPYAGIPLTLAAMAEDNRQKFVANGVAKNEALALGLIAAAPQVAIERLQANLVFKGKMPGFERWLAKPVTSKLELARKIAATGGLNVALENVEEGLQDITAPIAQGIASALSESVPEVDWDRELGQFAKSRVDTFFALLPLALVGTGTATFKEAAYGRAYLSDMKVLKAAGFSEEVANKIATAETVQEKETLVQDEWAKMREAAKVESDAAAGEVGAMDAANAQAQADAFAELDADMKASFQEQSGQVVGASAVMQEDGSYAVLDKEGGLVDVAFSPEAALALVDEVNKADDLDMSQAIQDMVDYFAPTNEPGQSIEVVDQRRTLREKVEDGEITQDEAQRAVDVAIALGNLDGSATIETVSIEGENVARFNAKTGLFEDVSRIYQGANPLVVVEERAEGYLKRRIQDGSLRWEDVQRWRDAVEGEQSNNSQRLLTEWFSKSAKAWMVGEAENLNEGIPASFRAFLRAMKEYFAQVLGLAKKLRELDAAGQLEDGYKMHLARAVGLDRSHLDAMERAEAKRQAGPEAGQYSGREALLEIGLPSPGKDTSGFNGELKTISEALNFGQRMQLFRGEKSLDDVATALRADYGFADIQTPDDVIKLAERVFVQGEEVMSSGSYETDVTLPDGARLVGPATFSLKAFHGTPHKVDKFTTSKIGTGEGAQAYGWGLYFAENPKVAQSYKNARGNAGDVLIDGKPASEFQARKNGKMGVPEQTDEELLAEWLRSYPKLSELLVATEGRFQRIHDLAKRFLSEGRLSERGNLYTVELLGEAEDFLDWDKPLSEQSEKVKAALAEIRNEWGAEFEPSWYKGEPDPTGAEIYRAMARPQVLLRGDPAEVTSTLMRNLGIKGIRYADAGSRIDGTVEQLEARAASLREAIKLYEKSDLSAVTKERMIAAERNRLANTLDDIERLKNPTFNYVIFDESLVRILEENGKPVGEEAATFSLAPKGRAAEMERKLRERRVSQRIANADHEGNAFSPDLQARMKDRMYEVVPLETTVNEALNVVKSKGVTEVANIVTSDAPEVPRSVQVALGVGLVEHFDATGNYAEAQRIAERVAELGTELGRAVNAFKLLGRVLDTPAKAMVFFKRQVAVAEKSMRERMPAAEAAQAAVGDVQKEAFKLFKRWLDEINGMTRLSKREAVRVEDLPEVTFSLTAEQKASGIVSVVAKMLRESGADATEAALLERYGPAVEKALPDLFIEAQKLNTKRKTASGKGGKAAKRDSKAGEGGKGAPAGQDASTRQETPNLTDAQIEETLAETRGRAESQSNLEGLEGFTEVLVNKVVEQVRVKGLETPEQVRDAVRNLFKVHGINATPETVAEVFKRKFSLPKMTDAQAERVSQLAQNIASTPDNSAERTDATIALVDYVNAQLREVDIVEKAWAVWYANVLSGYNTHARNLWANFLSLGTELPLAAVKVNPMDTILNLRELFYGVPAGVKVGVGEGVRQLKTGQTSILRAGENKFKASDALEKAPFKGGNANPFNWLKVVKRLLTAEDLFAFGTAQETKARMVAWEMAKSSGLEGEALANEIERLLNNTEEQLADFGKRAELEWDKLTDELKAARNREDWIARRVEELRISERKAELIERASDFAARATFNYRPEGSLGVLAGMLMDGLGKVGRMEANSNSELVLKAVASSPKLVFPFIRIATNVLNRGLDYSGVGVIRSAFPKKLTYAPGTGPAFETKTVDERDMELKRGILGIITMGLLSALASPDDDEAPIQIHGAGSGDRSKNQALNGPTWMPYSVEFRGKDGSRFVTFQYSPLAVGLAILGNWHDARRYKRFNEEEANERLAAALTGAGSVILDQSFMASAADLLRLMGDSGSVSEKALYSFLGRTFNPATAIPFSNLVSNVERDFDEKKRDATSIKAALMANVPVVRRFNKPALDVLGDEMENRPLDWFTRAEKDGTPEARIYRMFAAKNVHPSNLWSYKGEMEPEQFYQFTKVRGQFIKDELMRNGGSLIEEMMKLDDEQAKEVMSEISRDATAYAKQEVGYIPKPKKP